MALGTSAALLIVCLTMAGMLATRSSMLRAESIQLAANAGRPAPPGPPAASPFLAWLAFAIPAGYFVIRSIRGRAPAIATYELAHHRCPTCGDTLKPNRTATQAEFPRLKCGADWPA